MEEAEHNAWRTALSRIFFSVFTFSCDIRFSTTTYLCGKRDRPVCGCHMTVEFELRSNRLAQCRVPMNFTRPSTHLTIMTRILDHRSPDKNLYYVTNINKERQASSWRKLSTSLLEASLRFVFRAIKKLGISRTGALVRKSKVEYCLCHPRGPPSHTVTYRWRAVAVQYERLLVPSSKAKGK